MDAGISLPGLTASKVQWVDINNDGNLDLFLTGTSNTGALESAIHVINADHSLDVIIFLPALKDVEYDFADYDTDSFVDLILQGSTIGNVPKTFLLKNLSGAGFEEVEVSFAQVTNGSVLFADFDKDGDHDVLVGGFNENSVEGLFAYENENGTFAEVETDLLPISNGDFSLIDVESDGIQEVIITGLSVEGNPTTTIYAVDSEFHFVALDIALPVSAFSNVIACPADDDFYEEILLGGLIGSNLNPELKNFKNTLGQSFSEQGQSLEILQQFSLDAGDLNHDGLIDVWMTGRDNDGDAQNLYYVNSIAGQYLEEPNIVEPTYHGDVSFGDYDNDGDLDLLQTGSNQQELGSTHLWLSDQSNISANSSPTIPSSLTSAIQWSRVELSWARATDDHTPEQGISYNLHVRKESGAQAVVSPNSIITSGKLTVPQTGNNRWSNTAYLNGLEEGMYYWSVQSIDNSFASSQFANEQSFLICDSISIGPDRSLCIGDTLSISVEFDDSQVDWYSAKHGSLQSDSNSISFSLIELDSISVTISRPSGCVLRDTVVVIPILPTPITVGADRHTCFGDTVSIEISTEVEDIRWYVNGLEAGNNQVEFIELPVVTNDTIIAMIHDLNLCINYDTIVSYVRDLPIIDLGMRLETCTGDTARLDIPSDYTIRWKSQVDAAYIDVEFNSIQKSIAENQLWYFEIKDVNKCVNYDTLQVNAIPLPTILLGDDLAVCKNQEAMIDAVATGQVSWYTQTGELLESNSVSYHLEVSSGDTLVALVINENNCVNSDSLVIDVLPLPAFDLGSDTSLCYNEKILIQAGVGFSSVEWYSEASQEIVENDSWFLDITVHSTDSLRVKVTNEFGCFQYDSIKITMNPLPVFSAGEDFAICRFDSAVLEIAELWTHVNWYFSEAEVLALNSPVISFAPNESLTVFAEVIDSLGCVAFDSVNIQVAPLPTIELGEDVELCAGAQLPFGVLNSPGFDYKWITESNEILSEAHVVLIPPVNQKVILEIMDLSFCKTQDSINVIVNPLPLVDIQGDSLLCAGEFSTWQIYNLQAESITWWINDFSTLQADPALISAALFESSKIRVSLTDFNGCAATDSLEIIIHQFPEANAGEDLLLCYGDTARIGMDQLTDLVFAWSPALFLDNSLIANPTTSPETSIQYILKVSNTLGCSSIDTVNVEVNPEIFVDAGQDAAICLNKSFTLGGTPTATGSKFPFQYEWSDNYAVFSDQANPIVSPSQSTTYYLLVSTGKCEVFLDSIFLEVYELPNVSISASDFIGVTEPIQLIATGALEYNWSPPDGLSSVSSHDPIATPATSTEYFVLGTDAHGCVDTASVRINVLNSVFLPSVFTPNADGHNDQFKVYGAGIEQMTLNVYDQKGEIVFQSKDWQQIQEKGWDGKKRGQALESDVYFWIIDGNYYNGEEVRFQGEVKGIVRLLR